MKSSKPRARFCGRTRPSPDEADQVIEHLKDKGLGVGFACRVLGLSESAYDARKTSHRPGTTGRADRLAAGGRGSAGLVGGYLPPEAQSARSTRAFLAFSVDWSGAVSPVVATTTTRRPSALAPDRVENPGMSPPWV